MAAEIVRVTTREHLEQAWDVRLEVFVREQGVPLEEEIDDLDTAETTTHFLAVVDGQVVGTVRLLRDPAHPDEIHLGRLAVRAAARGHNVGAALVVAVEAEALVVAVEAEALVAGQAPVPDQAVTVVLSAQEAAMGFYERLGYAPVSGERYLDAGIWHQDMARLVSTRP
jgi:predicted GNAT family N-acyltransferase